MSRTAETWDADEDQPIVSVFYLPEATDSRWRATHAKYYVHIVCLWADEVVS